MSKTTTTLWHYFPSFGGYYRLLNDTLMHCPANTDGSRAVGDDCEVDMFRISEHERHECMQVKARLSANPTNPDTSEVQS